MPVSISVEQLDSFRLLIAQGRIGDFYTLMLESGYSYAGWARGVARGDTLSGLAARLSNQLCNSPISERAQRDALLPEHHLKAL